MADDDLSATMFGSGGDPGSSGYQPGPSALPSGVSDKTFEDNPQSPPPGSTTGKDPSAPTQDQITQAQSVVDAKIKAVEDAKRQMDDIGKQRDEALKALRESITAANQRGPDGNKPQPYDSNMANNPPHIQQAAIQVNQTWPAMVMLGIGLAGMIGKHHGTGSTSGYFLGSMMEAYSKAHNQYVKEARDNWWKQVEYDHQVNNERLANYRAALQDQRFDLSQKMDVLKTYADQYGDARMSHAAASQDLEGANKILNGYQKAQDRQLKEAHKTASATDTLMKSSVTKQWTEDAMARYFEKNGQLPMTESEKLQALRDYKYSDWRKDQATYGPVDPATGQPTIRPKYPEAKDQTGFTRSQKDSLHSQFPTTPEQEAEDRKKMEGLFGRKNATGEGYQSAIKKSVDDMSSYFGE
jgi:hypothetical protein